MGEEKETEKKKKKSKSKDPKDPEDPEKKKKKKKAKSEKVDGEKVADKDSSDAIKDKKKKKKKDNDKASTTEGAMSDDESIPMVSDEEKAKPAGSPKATKSKKKSSSKDRSSKVEIPSNKIPELFDAGKPQEPTETALKYGDVDQAALQKKCKKIYKLLNFDPWNNAHRFDDDDLCDYVLDNPEPCKIKFEFDGFSGCIYPLSMCFALKASQDTVEAVYDAFPAAVKETDWWIGTPYHYAAAYKAPAETVKFLLQKNPKGVEVVNYYGRTPLHLGALFKAPAQSMELICNKYPLATRIKDKDGSIPLHMACEHGAESEVVRLLVNTYPLSVYASAQYNMTPLHFAVSHEAKLSVVRAILEAAGEVSVCKAVDLLGHTPLHCALMGLASFDVVELLVAFCPETVWMKTNKGELPLEIAQRKRAPAEVLQILENVMERLLVEGGPE
jgi:hypothetical protein